MAVDYNLSRRAQSTKPKWLSSTRCLAMARASWETTGGYRFTLYGTGVELS